MAPPLALALGLVASTVLSEVQLALCLVQTRATRLEGGNSQVERKTGVASPGLDELLQRHREHWEATEAHVHALDASLRQTRDRVSEELKEESSSYNEKLAKQERQLQAIEARLGGKAEQVEELRNQNTRAAEEADQLRQDCLVLVRDIEGVMQNLSIANDFALEAIASSEPVLKSSEHEIMALLAAKEKHEKNVEDIDPGTLAALLQIGSQATSGGVPAAEKARSLLKKLIDDVVQLKEAESKSHITLHESFEKAQRHHNETMASMLSDEAHLDSALRSALELREELGVATEHLRSTHQFLSSALLSLRLFGTRLSTMMPPEAPHEMSLSEASKSKKNALLLQTQTKRSPRTPSALKLAPEPVAGLAPSVGLADAAGRVGVGHRAQRRRLPTNTARRYA